MIHVLFARHPESKQNAKGYKAPGKDSPPSAKGWQQLTKLRENAATKIKNDFPTIWDQIKAKNYEVHMSPLARATFTGLVLEQSVVDLCQTEVTDFNAATFLNRQHYTIYKALQEIANPLADPFRHLCSVVGQHCGPSHVGKSCFSNCASAIPLKCNS